VAAATLAASLLLTACRLFTPDARLLLVATALVPWALPGYAVALAAWWAVRRLGAVRRLAAAAAVVSALGLVAQVGFLAPSYVGAHASGDPDLTVLTANLHLGTGDAAELVHTAVAGHADVVVLEEVTVEEDAALAALREVLPYAAGSPAPGPSGTIVLSRYPLEQVTRIPVSKGAWAMRVGAPVPFSLIGLHTSQPAGWPSIWTTDQARILAAVRAVDGPLVVAGDFNATLDHRPMRTLLGTGLADAARQANSGWQPTWPSDRDTEHALPWGVGAMALDHVLVSRQFSSISTSTRVIRGTDHRALLVRLAVR
jgi:endonuclease/exonuclease/phosphatase (EEP) superfamily protein YafD